MKTITKIVKMEKDNRLDCVFLSFGFIILLLGLISDKGSLIPRNIQIGIGVLLLIFGAYIKVKESKKRNKK